MRLAIFNYIKHNSNDIQIQKAFDSLLPEHYLNTSDHIQGNCDIKSYLKESLLVMNSEADNFVIFITPIVFSLNIKLHILEGSGFRHGSMFNYCVKKLNTLSKEHHHTVDMLYRFSGFTLLYSTSELKNNLDLNQIISDNYIQKQVVKRITILPKSFCELCKKNEEYMKFDHFGKAVFCKACCKAKINKLINQRVRTFIENDFINIECNQIFL